MKTAYNVGIYCRLSREDKKNTKKADSSLSIENQQAMLEKYVATQGWNVYRVYVDDGVSGTTFDRPQFKTMIQAIKDGKINCVVTKDLSRFGRNYCESASYREFFFDHGVRFFTVNDGGEVDDDDISIPIKEMLNEVYAKDIGKKVRATKKLMAEQGKFSNSRAPYGYLKSADNKHVLVVDENVSHNVIRIFELYLGGKTARAIADLFSRENITTPNEYFYSTINKPNPHNRTNTNKWNSGSIMNIIKNPAYYGAMANGKRAVKSFKDKTVIRKDVDEWIIVEDTHEPLISKERWLEAQQIGSANKKEIVRRSADGEVSIFSGLLRCADCGGNMALKRRPNKTIEKKEFYRCSTYVQKGKGVCSTHAIDLDVLSEAVLQDIQQYAVLAAEDEKKLIDELLKANGDFRDKSIQRYEKTIRESKNRIKQIDGILQNLYEDKLSGEITADIFKRLAQKNSDEQTRLIADVEQLEAELDECKRVEKDVSGYIKRIKECLTIESLTRAIVVELIDRIEVSEICNVDGEKILDISIRYKFKPVEFNRETLTNK